MTLEDFSTLAIKRNAAFADHRVCRAPPSAAIFVDLIIKAPVIPIISMILGMVILAIELPLPALKKLSIHRTLVPRVVLLLFQVFFNILYYQVRRVPFLRLAMC